MKRRYKILNGFAILLLILITALSITIGYTADCEPRLESTINGESMMAIEARCYGDSDVLEYVEVAKPVPGAKDLLVKVHAASINPSNWHHMTGSPYVLRLMAGIGKPKNNAVGTDFSGVVVAVGNDVTKFKVGDAVFGGARGAYAQYLTVREDRAVALKPENVSHEQAAAVAVAGITALQAVRDKGEISEGDKVLINGSSGGVGTHAVQIAKALGAEVIGVNSTRNVAMVKSIGADHVIDYTVEDYTTQNIQYDVIIDMVGNNSLSENIDLLSPGGRLVVVGGKKGDWIAPFVTPIQRLFMQPFVDHEILSFIASLNQPDMDVLAQLMQEGKLKPVVGHRFELSEVAAAMDLSGSRRAQGKIIITIE